MTKNDSADGPRPAFIRITTTARFWVWFAPLLIAAGLGVGVAAYKIRALPAGECSDTFSTSSDVKCRPDQDLVRGSSYDQERAVICRCRRNEVQTLDKDTGKRYLCRPAP